MKKTIPEAAPRKVVMPLAAAALLAACDQRPATADRSASLLIPDFTPSVAPQAPRAQRVRNGASKTRDQASIGTRVKAALLARVGAEAGAIRVASRSGGVVILSGTVQSPSARVRARRIASSVASVTSVTDQLKVKS